MSNSWHVVNQYDEFSLFESQYTNKEKYPSFLTNTPEAFFSLQNSNKNYKSPHEFVTKKQLNNISEKNFNFTKLITQTMDNWFHQMHPQIPISFNPFYSIEHGVKNFIDSLAFSIKELHELCMKENVKEITYVTDVQENDYIHYINKNNKNRYFSIRPIGPNVTSLVLDQDKWWNELGINTVPIYSKKLKSNINEKPKLKNKISNLINPNRIDLIKQFTYRVPRSIFKNKKDRLLVIGQADNVIPFLLHSINSDISKLDWWVRDTFDPVNFPTFKSLIFEQSEEENINFTPSNIPNDLLNHLMIENNQKPLINILYKCFKSFYKYRIPYLLSLYLKAQSYFKTYQPIAIISGTTDPDRIQIIHQAAKIYKIPLISFQHGGAYGYTETKWIQLSDLRADIYAAYGAKSCEYIEKFAKSLNMPTKLINIGWQNGKQISKKANYSKQFNNNTGRKIIYVPTGMMGDNRYGPNHDQMHDIKYCLEQIEIIQTLSKIPNTETTVKLHYKDKIENPIENFIINSNFTNVKVVKYCNFVELLNEADVIIIDCPTTVIIESLASCKNVIYINLNIVKFTNEGETLLKESVLWIEKNKNWKNDLQKSINKFDQLSKNNTIENSFMQHYANTNFTPENIWKLIKEDTLKI
ncbi:MAG: hypothetical protein CL766_00390 [Chloroflexi bacterium]|nr:hypothetical protein [Chloroflexota bacterium]